jgi:hypothetical protein
MPPVYSKEFPIRALFVYHDPGSAAARLFVFAEASGMMPSDIQTFISSVAIFFIKYRTSRTRLILTYSTLVGITVFATQKFDAELPQKSFAFSMKETITP